MKYRARITLPENIVNFVQTVQGLAGVIGITDQYLDVEFTEDDVFVLGRNVAELENELRTGSYYNASNITISRPYEVTDG